MNGARKLKDFSNSRGNAVLLILPLMVVVATVIEMNSDSSNSVTKTVTNFRIISARNTLVSNLNTYSTMPATFRSSLHPSLDPSLNSALKNCVFGSAPGGCVATETPMTMYAPVSSSSATPSTPLQAIAGPPTNPILYDTKGNICSTPTGPATLNCPFQVSATFIPTCAGAAGACTTALSVSIHYTITTPASIKSQLSGVVLKDVDQRPLSVSALNIAPPLPPTTPPTTTPNVSVRGKIPSMAALTAPTPSSTGPSINDIDAAVIAGGITDPTSVATVAQAFINAGYASNLSLITQVTHASVTAQNPPQSIQTLTYLIGDMAEAGYTDTSTCVFLTNVGVADASWMQTVVKSGVTDIYFDNEVYGTGVFVNNPTGFANSVNAALTAGIAEDARSVAIIGTGSTDPTLDSQLYASVKGVSDDYIAAGLIAGKMTSDATQMNSIVSAVGTVSGSNSLVLGAIAQLGVTNPTLAQQLASSVSSIANPYYAAYAILGGNSNINTTQTFAAQLVAGTISMPTNSGTVTQTPAPITPSTPVMTPAPGSSGSASASSTADSGGISSCTNCSILTF